MDRVVVHRRDNYAFAIAMHSNRIENYESMDEENLSISFKESKHFYY